MDKNVCRESCPLNREAEEERWSDEMRYIPTYIERQRKKEGERKKERKFKGESVRKERRREKTCERKSELYVRE